MNCEEEKLMQKSGLHNMKHHSNGSFKIIVLFPLWQNLSARYTRYTKWKANLDPRDLSLAFLQYYFFLECCWYFQIPAPSADNKRGGKLISGSHRATLVIATIIYFCSTPVFSFGSWILGATWPAATRVQWSKRENPGNEVAMDARKRLKWLQGLK